MIKLLPNLIMLMERFKESEYYIMNQVAFSLLVVLRMDIVKEVESSMMRMDL